MRIDDALADAVERLQAVSDSPRLDAQILLARALDVSKTYLIAHPEDILDNAAVDRYFAALARRRDGVPLAYITGEKEFWSLTLTVGPDTLVPRPETELLVELALRHIPRDSAARILDLGTGSGAVALAIAGERLNCQVTATDVSAAALAVAMENARQLQLDNLAFVQGDWTAPVAGQSFDLIVSNPPYVRNGDPALEALKHEPTIALTPGHDGLEAIRTLARDCRPRLVPDGLLIFEHGVDQKDEVASILQRHDWSDIECFNDLSGRPRVTVANRGDLPGSGLSWRRSGQERRPG